MISQQPNTLSNLTIPYAMIKHPDALTDRLEYVLDAALDVQRYARAGLDAVGAGDLDTANEHLDRALKMMRDRAEHAHNLRAQSVADQLNEADAMPDGGDGIR